MMSKQNQYKKFRLCKAQFVVLFVFLLQIISVQSIYQICSSNPNCPPNSFCGYRRYCICNDNFILNCDVPSVDLSSTPTTVMITQKTLYYTIQPQVLFEYLKFSIQISSNYPTNLPLVLTLWGQTGYLTNLTQNNKLQSISFDLDQNQTQILQTSYFQFGLQPNGESQVLYLGIRVNSTTPVSYQILLSSMQANAYNQDIFKLIITILMAALSVACLVLIAFCIYKRRRLNSMRERAQQEKQIKSTSHFDQYMPVVEASRVKIPLQVCSVCLLQITREEMVRLTICRHLFHVECLDSWCKKNISCPICRQELDLQNCQKILGQGLNLSEGHSIKEICENNRKELQLTQRKMKRNVSMNKSRQINEADLTSVIQNESSLRRGMLNT